MRSDVNRLVSLRELAELMGEPPTPTVTRRLRKRLIRISDDHGKRIVLQSGKGAKCFVALGALRECMPELFDGRREVERLLRVELEAVHERLAEALARDRAIGARLKRAEKRITALEFEIKADQRRTV